MRSRTREQDRDWKKAEYDKTPRTDDTRVKDKEWQRAYRERKRAEKIAEKFTETLRSPYLVLVDGRCMIFGKTSMANSLPL